MTQVIKPIFTEVADCIFIDKVTGLNTHASDFGRRGACEVFESVVGQKLYVVHRLDKATSGALVFAKSSGTAAKLSALFEKHQVQKRYLFVTDRTSTHLKDSFEASSHIEKEKNQFVSHQSKEVNSRTQFKRLKKLPHGELWEAVPVTGKPHQIRLHAQDQGISILGDDEHGGSPFPRLCLHSELLKFSLDGKDFEFKTSLPFWAQENFIATEATLNEAFETRERWYQISKFPDECMRLSHHEIDSYRLDQYGKQLWLYWYQESDPSENELTRFKNFAQHHQKEILIRKMLNRGDEPNAAALWKSVGAQDRWEACENGVRYELRDDTGLSPGLFLDQRENRLWVQNNSAEKKVLNLFSYTSGFSVNAALGKAEEVTTVDVSPPFLEWSKRNFQLNNLDPEKYEFWVSDSLVFLKGCYRRKRKFDLILCDPPSFGRSKNGTFSISKNYEELLTQCFYCLNKGGLILFSTNYEKWTLADLKKNLTRLKSQFSFTLLETPDQGLDFEKPDQEPLMKSVLLRKN